MAKQLTAPGCTYSIVARVDTTIYSPDQKWTLDVSAGQTDFIAETNEIIIPGDAMLCRKTKQHSKDRNRINLLGTGSGSLATFVTRAVEQIVGKGNVKVEYGAGKVTVALALSATDAQIVAVENLLERMLPKDVAGEIDPFPTDYTRVEYLEKTGGYINAVGPHIILPIQYDAFQDVCEFETCHLVDVATGNQAEGSNLSTASLFYGCQANGYTYFGKENTDSNLTAVILEGPLAQGFDVYKVQATPQNFTVWLNGLEVGTATFAPGIDFVIDAISVFAACAYKTGKSNDYPFNGKKKYFKLWLNNKLTYHLIPAITPEGQPCLYDLVSKTTFYNVGSGDFIYPSTGSSTTYSLRRPVAEWGKLTPHGVRRLYKLPDSYTGDTEQYIAENGFKRLVETEKPEEGYWEQVWRETDTELVLDWHEVDPPIEEEFTTQEEQLAPIE